VVGSLEDLQGALADAGVDDPAEFDADDPPEGVTEEQLEAIARAADAVGSAETRDALAGLEQQARDVCKTPLGL